MNTAATIQISDIEEHSDLKKISLSGQIDESNLADISSQIDEATKMAEVKIFILDLKNLEFINSKVIGYIASLHSRLDTEGRRIIFMKATDEILEILDLVGLINLIPNFESVEDILSAIETGEL